NGSATAVWENLSSNPSVLAQRKFAIYVSYASNAPSRTIIGNLSYGPTSPFNDGNFPYVTDGLNGSGPLALFTIPDTSGSLNSFQIPSVPIQLLHLTKVASEPPSTIYLPVASTVKPVT